MKSLLCSCSVFALTFALFAVLLVSAPIVSADPPAPGEPTPEYQPPDPDAAPPISEGIDKKKKITDAKKINKPDGTPNLVPYTPSGWSSPIVPAPVTGTTTTGTLTGGKTAYIDYAYKNVGTATASGTIYTCLYLDGTEIRRSNVTNLAVNVYGFTKDFAYTVATPGNHKLKIKTDCTNVIAESNENDNVWEKTFYWQGPNLVPFTPGGWSEPIVVSYVKNTSASSALYATLPAYFDYAIKNTGEVSSSATIYTCLYLDGAEVKRFSIAGLNTGAWKGNLDWSKTVSTTGNHTVKITADCTNAVKETNENDNSWSKTFTWSDANLDTDGDALLDRWERYGYDDNGDGTIDVDLPNLGANYTHRDLYVSVDWMQDKTHSHKPSDAAIKVVIDAFTAAPVNNPDKTTGVALHVEMSNSIAHQTILDLTSNWNAFDTIKQANFENAKRRIYRYAVFAHQYKSKDDKGNVQDCSSGIAHGVPGSDFLITLGCSASGVGTRDEQSGTFMHELGHTIGLRHGGADDTNYKPNYLSIMSYRFQFSGLRRNNAWGTFDYSRFSLPTLNETALNESTGLAGGAAISTYGTSWSCPDASHTIRTDDTPNAINWDCDAKTTEPSVSVDINYGAGNTGGGKTSLSSQNDWTKIIFKGGSVGTLTAQEEMEAFAQIVPVIEASYQELDDANPSKHSVIEK